MGCRLPPAPEGGSGSGWCVMGQPCRRVVGRGPRPACGPVVDSCQPAGTGLGLTAQVVSAGGKGQVRTAALTLGAANAVVAAVLSILSTGGGPAFSLSRLLAFGVGFALVGLFPMRLEF